MLIRGSRLLIVMGVVLAVTQLSYGSTIFSGSISMSDTDLGDLNNVAKNAPITLDVAASVNYLGTHPGDDINWIQLRFVDSTLDLTGATWAWDADTSALATAVESSMADEIVSRSGAGTLIQLGTFDIGILSFNAPTTLGTYTVKLTGGDLDAAGGPTNTLLADGVTEPGALYENNDLELGEFTFTVIPEPTTMAVLGCGGLLALLRRKRRG